MLKRYKFWLWTAVVFMFPTGAFHSLSLFVRPVPANETKRQIVELMTTYKNDWVRDSIRQWEICSRP